jgi:hypothetical protein
MKRESVRNDDLHLTLAYCGARLLVLNLLFQNHMSSLRVPREPGRIGKRVRFPRGPATVMLSKLPATKPLIRNREGCRR